VTVGSFRVYASGVSYSVESADVLAALRRFPRQFAKEAEDAFKRMGAEWEGDMKEGFTGYTGQSSPRTLQNRSGNLRRTIQYRTRGRSLRSLALVLQVGDNRTPYAQMQEYGGVIRPRRGQYLTVPLRNALTPSGVTRGEAIIRRGADGYYTDLGKTRIVTFGAKKFIAVRVNGQLRLLYMLVRSVTVPGPNTGAPSRLGANRRAKALLDTKLIKQLELAARRAYYIGSTGIQI
jgi:hypothetical protein